LNETPVQLKTKKISGLGRTRKAAQSLQKKRMGILALKVLNNIHVFHIWRKMTFGMIHSFVL
jgi:hypothetical protein